MSQKAIIHTATRVIRRLTTDDRHGVSADETLIDLGEIKLDLSGGPWKLDVDNQTTIKASEAEIEQAFSIPQPTALIELLNSLTDIRDDTNLPNKVRIFAGRLKNWLDRKSRVD